MYVCIYIYIYIERERDVYVCATQGSYPAACREELVVSFQPLAVTKPQLFSLAAWRPHRSESTPLPNRLAVGCNYKHPQLANHPNPFHDLPGCLV